MKPTTEQKIEQLLKSANLRRTKPRIAALSVLLSADKPINQQEIADKAGVVAPDKVTIYRILETFIEAGIVHKAFIKDRTQHYELAHNCTKTQCHPHFTCKNCGTTNCLIGFSVPTVEGLKKGFVIHRQQVRLEGLCPACNTRAKRMS